jgi:energy-coupling factor transporter ATP-binding protein EcfA2
MKIVKLVAENIKKLTAVEITPTGDLVKITGPNGSGKSSVIDAIWWALAGAKHIQAVPINRKARKARIRLDLGEIVVERHFAEGKASTLTVEKADGSRFTSPQTLLDGLLGELSFDPLSFVNEEPREQFDTLRGIVNLEVDIDRLEGLNLADYDARTDLSRSARTLRAQAEGIWLDPAAEIPATPVDTSALLQRMEQAASVNSQIEMERAARLAGERLVLELEDRRLLQVAEAAELRRRADECDRKAGILDREARKAEAELKERPALADPVDVAAIRHDLEAANLVNRLVEQRARRQQFEGEADDLERQAREITERMDARVRAKEAAIAAAQMPVEGLSLGDGIVTFNGIPFAQASTAEQLRVSVAIAMAANPKIRVIRIKEGSLLDQSNLALIAAMAHERDYQVWLEIVDTSGKIGIVIEDGHVAAVNPE